MINILLFADAFLRNLDTYEITYPEALEVDYKLTEKHRRLRRDVSDNRPSYYEVNKQLFSHKLS